MKTLTKKAVLVILTVAALFMLGTTEISAQNLTVINNTDCGVSVEAAQGSLCVPGCSSGINIGPNDTGIIQACSLAGDWIFINYAAAGSTADSRSYNTQLNPVCGFDLLNTTCNNVLVVATWTAVDVVELN